MPPAPIITKQFAFSTGIEAMSTQFPKHPLGWKVQPAMQVDAKSRYEQTRWLFLCTGMGNRGNKAVLAKNFTSMRP